MAITTRVSPAQNGEGTASAKAAPSEMRLATRGKHSGYSAAAQGTVEARFCEERARINAGLALNLSGGLAFQYVALSRHYAGRAVALMAEASR